MGDNLPMVSSMCHLIMSWSQHIYTPHLSSMSTSSIEPPTLSNKQGRCRRTILFTLEIKRPSFFPKTIWKFFFSIRRLPLRLFLFHFFLLLNSWLQHQTDYSNLGGDLLKLVWHRKLSVNLAAITIQYQPSETLMSLDLFLFILFLWDWKFWDGICKWWIGFWSDLIMSGLIAEIGNILLFILYFLPGEWFLFERNDQRDKTICQAVLSLLNSKLNIVHWAIITVPSSDLCW